MTAESLQKNLKSMTDQSLEIYLKNLVQQERKLLHEILLHIQEVDSRKLYLKKAYSSLFAYLTEELKYSAAAAQRRIEASRLAKQIPDLIPQIQNGNLNLSNIGEVQRAVKISEKEFKKPVSLDTKKHLLQLVVHKSGLETQKICSQILDLPLIQKETQKIQKDESKVFQLTLSKEQWEKLEKVKGLMAVQLLKQGDLSTANILENLCDLYLNQKLGKSRSTSAAEVKSIPVLRKRLLQKTPSCQWMDHKTGKTCESKFNLQIDHIHPRWDQGGNHNQNLRVLCQSHNLYRYEKGL